LTPSSAPRFWLWPNLLSLDAPIVAVLWQILFARCFHAEVPAAAAALLVLAVWLIYAADRVFDARGGSKLPRHEFYRRHWRVVLPVWTAAFAFAAWLACTRLPTPLLQRGAVIAVAVVVYFTVVHAIRSAWPKELAVAILFAVGATVAAWNAIRSAVDVEIIVLFSCLCWINCMAIEQWERRKFHWPIGIAAMLVAAAAAFTCASRPVLSGAEMASALAFVYLDFRRRRLSADALRVLADVALLTPVFFLPLSGLLR
jgi:hypothetical protein